MIVIGVLLIAASRPLAKLAIKYTSSGPQHSPIVELFGGEEGWLFFSTMISVIIGLGFLGKGIAELV